MRITAVAISYPPHRRIGAEVALHELNRHLVARGHEVSVVTTDKIPPGRFDKVTTVDRRHTTPDVVVAQGGLGVLARRWFPNAHHFVWAHNNQVPALLDVRSAASKGARVISNTHHMREVFRSVLGVDSLVLHPPVWPAERVHGDAVTLVNLTAAKGADVFYELAAANPEVRFLGVKGGYGKQDVRPMANVQILEHGPMDRVWAQTRVLLLPSVHESYSMTGVEAARRGIPAVASDLPGVREALGWGAVYPTDWQAGLQDVLARWDELSDNAALHAATVDTAAELDAVAEAMEGSAVGA